ncbi:MAG: Uncharacterized protein G01um101416_818 [Microgenomates group bacterium Gr01-1014_16]|nr:MAG: Uncharacterized protein G01um101416_818 [Microgenomates group bacterium Gr01-1014_16]
MDLKDLKVKKRDGSIEPYQPDKLVRIALAAGLTHRQALTLGTHIYDWALTQTQPIPTSIVRDQIISELKAVHPPAANLYLWYESTKHPPK